jgi:anti-sigma B factor antagonist
MEISSSKREGVTIVSISGSVDTFTSEHLMKTFERLIGEGQTKLIADLKDTEYVSSAGLRVFLANMKEARARGGDLRLVALRTPVLRVMQLTGFTKIFGIDEDIATAFRTLTEMPAPGT